MSSDLEIILLYAPAFLLVMFRVTGIFIFAPFFGSGLMPMRVKALLALVLSICVYPMIPPQPPPSLSLWTMAWAVGSELLIGLIIGYGASLPLVAMQSAGTLMGQQLGLGLARVFNPALNSQTDVVGRFFFLSALAVFMVFNGHHALIAVLVHSFAHVPLGGYVPGGELVWMMTGLLKSMLELAIRVAAPLLCLVFLESIAMGFIARTAPQFNLLSLGFPIRIIVGLILLIGLAAIMQQAFIEQMRHVLDALFTLFGA